MLLAVVASVVALSDKKKVCVFDVDRTLTAPPIGEYDLSCGELNQDSELNQLVPPLGGYAKCTFVAQIYYISCLFSV